MNEHTKLLEAILLAAGTPVKKSKLQKQFENLPQVLVDLKQGLEGYGIFLYETEYEVEIVTHPDCADVLRTFFEVGAEEISPSLLEVLSIIAYGGPLARSEIEKIRGVNSVYVLKQLLLRGLVEKTTHPEKKHIIWYAVTEDFLKYLGVTAAKDLPEYAQLRENIMNKKTPGENI